MISKWRKRLVEGLRRRSLAAPPRAETLIFEPLEPRILLSADLPLPGATELSEVPAETLLLTDQEVAALQADEVLLTDDAPRPPKWRRPRHNRASDRPNWRCSKRWKALT